MKEPDGIWLYVEQAAAERKDTPYLQRIYYVTQQNDSTFISTLCDLDSMQRFTGAYKDVARCNGLKTSEAKPLPVCVCWPHVPRGGHPSYPPVHWYQ